MTRKVWLIIILSLLMFLVLILLLFSNRPISPSTCTPDIPVTAGLLTSPPTDIVNVGELIPLGNLNPGGGHVLPVDHMYLSYPTPAGSGRNSYPVYNMADGQLFMLMRTQNPGRMDYQIFIKHSCSVYSYFDHLHSLSPDIETYLTSNSVAWHDLSGSGSGPWMAFLGQSGEPAMMSLASGDQIGETRDYSHSWDVGLVDTRQTNGIFANVSASRYPGFSDFVPMFPELSYIDLSIYNLGNKRLNAACFIDYMDNSVGMQTAWHARLASTPKGCGNVGWDTPGYLRGSWFNPALDSLPGVVMDNEVAAFSIIPDNFNPASRIQIGIGNAANGTTVPNLALLDPVIWAPPVSAPQVQRPLFANIDTTAGTVVNPNPATVEPGVTVCYDLSYDGYYNTMLLHMTDSTHLKVKYDPTARTTAQCIALATGFPAVDSRWIEYVR